MWLEGWDKILHVCLSLSPSSASLHAPLSPLLFSLLPPPRGIVNCLQERLDLVSWRAFILLCGTHKFETWFNCLKE